MKLRPRQQLFVDRCIAALEEHGDTMGVAPTGAGKTIMLAGVTGRIQPKAGKTLILQHRDELTVQNLTKLVKVIPGVSTSVVDANQKNWRGQVVFGMVPTLTRSKNLDDMPSEIGAIGIDECHHAVAESYKRIINKAREKNPSLLLFGVTATPNRGDGKGLREVFSNLADQISVAELIKAGNLVPPRTFVIDVGTQKELLDVRKTVDDYDMNEVAAIMDRKPVTEAVIRHWKEKAGNRQTVVFCSTVDHAKHVADEFQKAGVSTAPIWGDMGAAARKTTLKAFEKGEIQVVTNVAVLTEGWDHQPTSCVVLLRPSSFKSTMVQMVGRGLRSVDPEMFPGVIKTDAIVLDFGISTLTHGSIEQDVNLDGRDASDGEGGAPKKECPDCEAQVPIRTMECPFCGHVWEGQGSEQEPLTDFVMSEIDLLKRSNFKWCDVFGDDAAMMATGFNGWAGVFFLNGRWYGVGGAKGQVARLLMVGERVMCMAAADDWLNANETDESAHKTKRWLSQPPTEKQIPYLPDHLKFNATRYQASCFLSFYFNKKTIQRLVFGAQQAVA